MAILRHEGTLMEPRLAGDFDKLTDGVDCQMTGTGLCDDREDAKNGVGLMCGVAWGSEGTVYDVRTQSNQLASCHRHASS